MDNFKEISRVSTNDPEVDLITYEKENGEQMKILHWNHGVKGCKWGPIRYMEAKNGS